MKTLKLIAAVLVITAIAAGCKKKVDEPPAPPAEEPKREVISYVMSVNPRVENKVFSGLNKDTLIIKVNGNTIISSKGSVSDAYQQYPVKTGDVISVYYHPGYTLVNGEQVYDENGLMLSLDYGVTNNRTLREYSCRCVANEEITLE